MVICFSDFDQNTKVIFTVNFTFGRKQIFNETEKMIIINNSKKSQKTLVDFRTDPSQGQHVVLSRESP